MRPNKKSHEACILYRNKISLRWWNQFFFFNSLPVYAWSVHVVEITWESTTTAVSGDCTTIYRLNFWPESCRVVSDIKTLVSKMYDKCVILVGFEESKKFITAAKAIAQTIKSISDKNLKTSYCEFISLLET